jgi:AmmeMemoRadiSam system protein A
VQLPFLQQKISAGFLLVPIILGTNNADDVKKIANVLSPFFTKENLFIISTDFSHYPAFSDAVEVDKKTADAICSNKPEILLDILKQNKEKKVPNLATSLCGWTSVLTLLYLTQNKNLQFKEIEYKNSGHAKIYGDKQRVVGYWAIAVSEKEENSFKITEEEQKELLGKARKSIEVHLKTGTRQPVFPSKTNGIINDSVGAFVSVYTNSELRGCIGSFAIKGKSLNEVVQKNAISAANDARFDSVKTEELENMDLEISVLSPMKKINTIEEIELGKHGIFIKKGLKRGTFLPQVAVKTSWTLNEFLGHCARDKAGIGWEGWKNAEIYTFEAFVFRESNLKSA